MPPLATPPRNSPHLNPPAREAFSAREWRLISRLSSPRAVQTFLDRLPYNTEPAPGGPTLRTFRGVVRAGTAHCLEAALTAAVILEHHGVPPRVMSLESIDGLDHVILVYQVRGRWGSVARSRDPGLQGRPPVFRSLRALAMSYFAPFIDTTGCLRAYGAADLRVLGRYDWRLSSGNVWRVAQLLYDIPHRPIRYSQPRVDRLRAEYYRRRRELGIGGQAKWLMVNGQWPMVSGQWSVANGQWVVTTNH